MCKQKTSISNTKLTKINTLKMIVTGFTLEMIVIRFTLEEIVIGFTLEVIVIGFTTHKFRTEKL